jgi:hypothetical protein
MFDRDVLIPSESFKANSNYNYIYGVNTSPGIYPKDDPLYVYDSSSSSSQFMTYKDIILGSIQLPKPVVENGLDLPFKYDYTIVPCMNYGRLDHLAVSNTVDFSKLHAFN